MAENLNLPLINILTSVDADVLRQIFTDISKKVNEMNVNSDEVIYTMMITSLEDKIESMKKIAEVQKNLINKIMVQFENNTNELSKYRDKYGEL